jgi:hypothetical protein
MLVSHAPIKILIVLQVLPDPLFRSGQKVNADTTIGRTQQSIGKLLVCEQKCASLNQLLRAIQGCNHCAAETAFWASSPQPVRRGLVGLRERF